MLNDTSIWFPRKVKSAKICWCIPTPKLTWMLLCAIEKIILHTEYKIIWTSIYANRTNIQIIYASNWFICKPENYLPPSYEHFLDQNGSIPLFDKIFNNILLFVKYLTIYHLCEI